MRKLGRKLRKPMSIRHIMPPLVNKQSDEALSTFNVFGSPAKSFKTVDSSDFKISPR